jgi:hypothetical protein
LDLQQSLIPASLIEHLANIMPRDASGEGYDYDSFLDVLVNGASGNGTKSASVVSQSAISTSSAPTESIDRAANGGMARGGSRHYL